MALVSDSEYTDNDAYDTQSRSIEMGGELIIPAKRVSTQSGYKLDKEGNITNIRSKRPNLPTQYEDYELDENEYRENETRDGTLTMQLYVNHEEIQLNDVQKQQIMELVLIQAAVTQSQKIKNNKSPNNENGIGSGSKSDVDVIIEFHTKDTLLSSIIAPETVHKVASILFHRIHIIFILLLVIFGIYLIQYQYDTMLRIIYGYIVCSWCSIVAIIVISFINSRALRHILSQFEFWIKLCYSIRFVACIATYFVLNKDTERYKLLSAGIAVPLGLSITLGVMFLGVFDGFYWIHKKNYIAMICVVVVSALCLCYYAIYFELFISEKERNQTHIAIGTNHTIYIDLVSNIANSSELLVLFLVKQCYYMIRIIRSQSSHDSQRAIAIRIVPVLRWIDNDATSYPR